jgi:hypothetical protein
MRDPGPAARPRLETLAGRPPTRRAEQPEPAAGGSREGVDPADGADYRDWTLRALRRRAAEIDLPGRSAMGRAELIEALRRG